MKRCASLAVTAVSLTALLVGLRAPLFAQAPPVPAPNGGLPNFNFQFNPAMFGLPAQVGGFVDPLHSAAMALLKRDDVRAQLLITGRQRESLEELDSKSRAEMQTTVQSTIREGIQNLQNVPAAELSTKIQERIGQFQTTVENMQNGLDKKVEAILRPDQITRLHELDLQWRGPLSLADKKVAEPFSLTTEQKTKLDAVLKEYQDAQRNAMMNSFMGRRNPPAPKGAVPAPPPANPNAAPLPTGPQNFTPATQEEIKARMEEMTKLSEKTRKTNGEKVLALLTPEQKQQWEKALGKLFTFRKNL